jgi:hypothetical protein
MGWEGGASQAAVKLPSSSAKAHLHVEEGAPTAPVIQHGKRAPEPLRVEQASEKQNRRGATATGSSLRLRTCMWKKVPRLHPSCSERG